MSTTLGWLSATERKAVLEAARREVSKEYAAKLMNLEKKALEDSEAKDTMISFLAPPKIAKNEYLEQKSYISYFHLTPWLAIHQIFDLIVRKNGLCQIVH